MGGAVESEPGVGGQRAGVAVDLVAHSGVRCGQFGERFGERGWIGAQGGDGPAGLVEALDGEAAGAFDELAASFDVALVAEEGLGGVELDNQASEGVGEDVVDLPGDAGPLVEHLGAGALGLCSLGLDGDQLCLLGAQEVLVPPQSDQQTADDCQCGTEQGEPWFGIGYRAESEGRQSAGGHPGCPQQGEGAAGQYGDHGWKDQCGTIRGHY